MQVFLFDPVADDLDNERKLPGQHFGTAAGANQVDNLLTKACRTGARDLGMYHSFQKQAITCPLKQVNSFTIALLGNNPI